MSWSTIAVRRVARFLAVALVLLMIVLGNLPSSAASATRSRSKVIEAGGANVSLLKTLDQSFRKKSMTVKVNKTTRLAVLGQTRKASGQAWISQGRLRMELDGEELTWLIVNKKLVWIVTFPPKEFKDGAVKVIKADTSTKKGRSQDLLALLTHGGFLQFFIVSGSQKEPNGDVLFFLSPKKEQIDFTRAHIKVSSDGRQLLMLKYWDSLQNETQMDFTDIQNDAKIDANLFKYSPPENASIVTL